MINVFSEGLSPHNLAAAEHPPYRSSTFPISHLHILSKISKTFFEVGLEQEKALSRMANIVALELGDACVMRLLSEDKQWLLPVAFEHRDTAQKKLFQSVLDLGPYRINEGLIGRCFESGRSFKIRADHEDSLLGLFKPEHRSLAEKSRIQSILVCPLRVRGESIGTLGVFSHEGGRDYDESDVLLMQEIAERAALLIEQIQLYKESREALTRLHSAHQQSQQCLRAVLMSSPGPVIVTKGESHLIELVNPAYERILPGSRDLLGKIIAEVFTPERTQQLVAVLDRSYRRGERAEINGLGILDRFFDWTCQPLHNYTGKVEGLVLQGIDVTEKLVLRRRGLESTNILLDF